eukprot:GAHX01001258.1.p1 GENE.GAHX01001258.1~~GAHX01001258.1.p1  ORF type:complete len:945 (-),score=200.08 GAHX01001258.1:42-2876(-)
MIFTSKPLTSEEYHADHASIAYQITNIENYTTYYTSTAIKKYSSINCGIPHNHSCNRTSRRSKMTILIPDIAFLKKCSTLIKKHISKQYHIVLIQTYLDILYHQNLLLYRMYMRLCSDPFLNISIYCDKYINYGIKDKDLKTKTVTKRALVSLKHHLEDNDFDYHYISGFTSKSKKSPQNSSEIEFSFLDKLSGVLEDASLSVVNNFLTADGEFKDVHGNKTKSSNKKTKRSNTSSTIKLDTFDEHMNLIAFNALPTEEKFIGRFTKRKNSPNGCVVSCNKATSKSVEVKGQWNCNRAVHGDLVGVVLGNTFNSTSENKVACIIKRETNTFYGTILPTDKKSGSVLFIPSNKAFPPISINTNYMDRIKGKLLSVALDYWAVYREFPVGHLLEILGAEEDIESQTLALLKASGFDVSHKQFPTSLVEKLEKSIPVEGKVLDKKYIENSLKDNRRDLRDRVVVSIDPEGCVDIDDAISVKKLKNNHYEIGVHIADVTSYVKENSPLDRIASERGTSVYLVQRRIDMLPGILSSNVCSLHENVDRLAFSILWECSFQKNGNMVLNSIFCGKSVIRNSKAFSYEQAGDVLSGKQGLGEDCTQHQANLEVLMKMAINLRNTRINNGAMILSKVEPKFRIDKRTLEPIESELYTTGVTNNMIEELMVLANTTAAEIIIKNFPDVGILRKHPNITEGNFEDLKKVVESFSKKVGKKFKLETQKDITKLFTDLEKEGIDVYNASLLSGQFSKRMNKAYYFCAGDEDFKGHFGLALNLYTHFTSPIRRYADVLVHRLLNFATLDKKPKFDLERIRKVVDNVNDRYLKGKRVGMDSALIYAKNCLSTLKGKKIELFISQVWEGGFVAYILDLTFNFKVFLVTGDDEIWKVNIENNKIFKNEAWLNTETEHTNKGINSIELFDKYIGEVYELEFTKKNGDIVKRETLKLIKKIKI